MKHHDSQSAYQLYQANKKKPTLARLYLMNAITHDSRIEYLREYAKLIGGLNDGEFEEALPQVYHMLTLAALNGPVEQVVEIQSLIAGLQNREFASKSIEKTRGGIRAHTLIVKEMARFSWASLRESDKLFDGQTLNERSEFLKQALSSGDLSESETETFVAELDQTQCQINLVATVFSVDEALKLTEDECESKSPTPARVAALMAHAAGLLNQMWVMKADGPMPKTELNAICLERQKRFSAIETEAQEILSKPAYAKVNEKMRNLEHDLKDADRFTTRIELCQNCAQKIQQIAPKILSPAYYSKTLDVLKKIADSAAEYGRQRYAMYQTRMASLALDAIRKYDSMKMVFESDAERILKDCKIASIDESLLSPEAASIYQSAKAMLTQKLSTIKRANFDYVCVTSEKFKLEHY